MRENLGAYDLWDDSLSQAEFGDIESHLHHCPACASEYADIRRAREVIEMTLAGVDRDAWEHEKKEFAAEILARLRDSGCFDGEEEASLLPMPLAASYLHQPSDLRQDDTRQGSMRIKRLLAMAASLLLAAFALPVLAFMSIHHLRRLPAAPESRVEFQEKRARTTQPAPPATPRGDNAQPGVAANSNSDFPVGDSR